jgi:hypothetical protein
MIVMLEMPALTAVAVNSSVGAVESRAAPLGPLFGWRRHVELRRPVSDMRHGPPVVLNATCRKDDQRPAASTVRPLGEPDRRG